MSSEKRDFDIEAATWDENPARVKLANDVADAIVEQTAPTPDMDVLDFGCGTGLLTLRLRPRVRSVTGIDSSEGMLAVLRAKASREGLNGVEALHRDLEAGDTLSGSYHLVTTSMTTHHIPELAPLLQQFFAVTAPSGHLCIADLDSEGGHFHGDNTGVFHFGFDRAELRGLLEAAGYVDVRDTTAAVIEKPDAKGELRRFSVFLITGRKPAKNA